MDSIDKKLDENISQIIGADTDGFTAPEGATPTSSIVKISVGGTADLATIEEGDLKRDYQKARSSLRTLIGQGQSVLEKLIQFADQEGTSRSYEVLADMMRTVSQVSKDLLELHHRTRVIREVGPEVNIRNETNNAIYVGSTKELQDLINPNRSGIKSLDAVPVEQSKETVIDAETIEEHIDVDEEEG